MSQVRFHDYLIQVARRLVAAEADRGIPGENPEYDRALVEFIIALSPGADDEDHERVQELIAAREFWVQVGGGVGRCRTCQGTDWITNYRRDEKCGHCGATTQAAS